MPKSKRKGGLSGVAKFILDLKESDETADRAGPMVKRRKVDTAASSESTVEGEWNKNYDATGLVPHYTHLDQVPPHLQKCWSNSGISFSLKLIGRFLF